MFRTESHIQVRYGETDQMGVLYHGNYATFYEIGRTEAFRYLGLTYREIEAKGIMMPVIELWSKFHKPAFYDDKIKIVTIIDRIPEYRMVTRAELYNEAGELINQAEVQLAFIEKSKNKIIEAPHFVKELLKPYF